MVHHIAGLIEAASDTSAADRTEREAAATEAILMFWDHRASVDRIDPLRDLKPLLKVIKTLDPDENRWGGYFARTDRNALMEVYSALREIIIYSLVAEAPTLDRDQSKFLAEDEAAIVGAVNQWLAEYEKEAAVKKPRRSGEKAKKSSEESESFDSTDHLLKQVGEAREALDALERQLKGLPPLTKPNAYEQLLRGTDTNSVVEIVEAGPAKGKTNTAT